METESTLASDAWGLRDDVAGALGDGYYEWKHGDNNQGIDPAGSGILTYSFNVTTPGSYRFLLRSSSPDFTEHNDVWVRFPDNSATGIRESGPGSIDITQNSWFKVYQNTNDQDWKWDARTVDNNPHAIYVMIEEPGAYSVELSGRSTLFKIDRLVLFNEQVSFTDATQISNPESTCAQTETLELRAPDEPADVLPGLLYAYYEGNWSVLPDFTSLVPVETGVVESFDISLNKREDYFGFLFKGFVEAPVDGLYTFSTTSNSGSQLYIGNELVVNNDSIHVAQSRSGIIALSAGLHEITVLFFEDFFAQTLTVAWSPPGESRQTLENNALFYNPSEELPTNITPDEMAIPSAITLYHNYPNPFSSTTTIAFDLAKDSHTRLTLYDTYGQLVAVMLDDIRPAGRTEIRFTVPPTLTSGLYIYRLDTPEQNHVGTMALVK